MVLVYRSLAVVVKDRMHGSEALQTHGLANLDPSSDLDCITLQDFGGTFTIVMTKCLPFSTKNWCGMFAGM